MVEVSGTIEGRESVVGAVQGIGPGLQQEADASRVAILGGDAEGREALLSWQVDLSRTTGSTPLRVSAQKGHTACVRLLLQAGADPLHCNTNGRTPLDAATHFNHPEVVALLQARIVDLARARP